ncbi:hypothetical protein [Gordonia humi]|uniref:Uncharacterized protein n=1 Tax=Gordonia humi TaxID=686429 RepID=A0A840EW51_9ACTN|nr:hypothetical protein [Gordonia humi]MBB4135902.1 hypothetical protein [Gordonia humi]
MSSYYRDRVIEWSQLFGGILTFGLLGKWSFLPTDYWGGELVKLIVDLVIAFLVVFIVCDIILGRPTVELEWRKDSRDRPLSGDVLVQAKKQTFNLGLKVTGGTVLQRYLLKRSLAGKFSVEVQIVPGDLVRLTKQGGTSHFRCRDDRRALIFDGVELDGDRTVCTADFTLKRVGQTEYTQEVHVRTSGCWEPKLWRTSFRLAKLESAVDRFVLEGISGGTSNHGTN